MTDTQIIGDSAAALESDLRDLIELDPSLVPDFSVKAVSKLAEHVRQFRSRLAAFNRKGLHASEEVNIRLVEAEINALDFFVRITRPFARDPIFYMTVFADQSDTAAHEGIYASTIDLWQFQYPLSGADAGRLEAMLLTVPPLLEQARANLAESQAHDLFKYGVQELRGQAAVLRGLEDGSLFVNSLEGRTKVSSAGHTKTLLTAITNAANATDEYANWMESEAPKRTGYTGVGKEAYSWAAQNIGLVPYDWEAQETLLKRELERSWAALAYEEFRNRKLPIQPTVEDPTVHDKYVLARADYLTAFMIDCGYITDKKYYRRAIPGQAPMIPFNQPEKRHFFDHTVALDPLPLLTHFYHWIELARVANEPRADPMRRKPPVLNVWQERCEGIATAMEELLLQSGLYDDVPRSKELVWIMLANRAARGLAALYVQANEMTLEEAGQFHARWTPRGYSDPSSPLVAFEQLLYARQPGYGASYVIGKLQLDGLIARLTERNAKLGLKSDVATIVYKVAETGFLPFSLIEYELMHDDLH